MEASNARRVPAAVESPKRQRDGTAAAPQRTDLLGVRLGLAADRPQDAAQLKVVLADLPVRDAAPRARRHL